MAKSKTVYFCKNCGAESPKWVGKCPSCKEWNTYTEEVIFKDKSKNRLPGRDRTAEPRIISNIDISKEKRIITNSKEFNRILGGGLVPGSVILIGGEPGIGKSTLALQIALNLDSLITLYISGEESNQQIKLRAERLKLKNDNCYLLNETSIENIFSHIDKLSPDIVIIDSIQTLYTDNVESSSGSISQIRECTTQMLKYAKELGIKVPINELLTHLIKGLEFSSS